MKKINSIHYGSRILAVGGIIGVIFPAIFWLLSLVLNNVIFKFARNIFFCIGVLVIFMFFIHLAVELYQDKRIDQYYSAHKKVKIYIEDGRYECYSCGNRKVNKKDSYCKICGVMFGEEMDKTPQEILDQGKVGWIEKEVEKMRERVMTDPKELVRIELKNAGFDIDSMQVPKRVYLLADGIYDAMIEKGCGEYKYPLGGALHVFKNNPSVGFIKGQMCSPGIATQAEDLIAGGVEEFIHVGLAGGINQELNIGDVVLTDGAYNDTAVARLYGFDYDFLETTLSLTDEMEQLLKENGINLNRGKHWTTDAGYRETWGQVLDYRSKGALCVEMEGVGLFTIAKYRGCSASAIYIITDVISEDGWHLGWEGNKIDDVIAEIIDVISG